MIGSGKWTRQIGSVGHTIAIKNPTGLQRKATICAISVGHYTIRIGNV